MLNRLHTECVRCILEKNLDAHPKGISEQQKLTYMQNLLRIVADTPATQSAPVMLRKINEMREQLFGPCDPFGPIKVHFNQLMLNCESAVQQKICNAQDSLTKALHYAIAGNYIDFGALSQVEETRLLELLETETPLNPDTMAAFRRDLAGAKRLLYITDNCGEIVMDKLLILTLRRLYPDLVVQVMVRGAPVLNDATREDACQVGMEQAAPVLDSGAAVAGTCVDELTGPALEAWQQADLILAKGQGNFETLRMCGSNVYYLFLCKCQMLADTFGVERLTGMFVNDRQL